MKICSYSISILPLYLLPVIRDMSQKENLLKIHNFIPSSIKAYQKATFDCYAISGFQF